MKRKSIYATYTPSLDVPIPLAYSSSFGLIFSTRPYIHTYIPTYIHTVSSPSITYRSWSTGFLFLFFSFLLLTDPLLSTIALQTVPIGNRRWLGCPALRCGFSCDVLMVLSSLWLQDSGWLAGFGVGRCSDFGCLCRSVR